MSFRRALLLLFLVTAVLSVPFYWFVTTYSLNQPFQLLLVIAVYFVVLGFLIRVLPGLKDSTEFIQNLFPGSKAARPREVPEAVRNDPRNRANVLAQVQNAWIEGFLHQSVHRDIQLVLKMKPQLGAVARNWEMTLKRSGQPDVTIEPEDSIQAVYVNCGRKLLILGAPGSGKTITLLQLAEALVKEAQAEPDAARPLPLVFNLSSWGQQPGPLEDWLVEAMLTEYQVARNLGRAWLEHGQATLLLDGLDEVAEAQRDACVNAINAFVEAFPADLVVCSRLKDYEQLTQRLNLSGAVVMQPLSNSQKFKYLDRPETEAVFPLLIQDRALDELAGAPLMLNVIAAAYANGAAPPPPAAAAAQERLDHIFAQYVARMFAHRPLPDSERFDEAQARRWLANVAAGMQRQDVSTFYLERLQPMWLQKEGARRLFAILVGLVVGLVVGLGASSQDALSELPERLIWRSPFSQPARKKILRGLVGGLVVGLVVGLQEVLVPAETGQRRRPNQGIRSALRNAIVGTLVFGLVFGLVGGLVFGLLLGWLIHFYLNLILVYSFQFLP